MLHEAIASVVAAAVTGGRSYFTGSVTLSAAGDGGSYNGGSYNSGGYNKRDCDRFHSLGAVLQKPLIGAGNAIAQDDRWAPAKVSQFGNIE